MLLQIFFFERDDNDVNNLNTLVEEFKNLMTFNPVHFLLPEEFSPEDRDKYKYILYRISLLITLSEWGK